MKNIFTCFFAFLTLSHINAQTPGNALHFDGAGDYVTSSLPSVFASIDTSDFTVETWVYPTGTGTTRIFFAQNTTTMFASILLNGSGVPYIYIYNGSASLGYNSGSTTLPVGQWSHIAVTWDASASQVQMYINGVLQTLTGGGSSSTGTNGLMALGSKTDGTQNLNGALDEFRIWKVARTQCQVQSTMNSELVGNETNLVHYYNFNQGTAGGVNTGVTTLPDITGTSTGTLNGFTLSGTTSNWIASGVNITAIGPVFETASSAMTICEGDTIVFGGNNLFASGTYSDTLISSGGCDSIHTLNLTVNNNSSHSFSATACATYDFNGDILSVSGTYYDTLVSANGCDSIVELNLIIPVVNTGVTASGFTLTANESGAVYQWLDCDAGFAALPGETGGSFIASTDGNYAVVVTVSGCSDTSICYPVTGLGTGHHAYLSGIKFYPNPSGGTLYISGKTGTPISEISVTDIQGRSLLKVGNIALPLQLDITALPAGTYLVTVMQAGEKKIFRLVRE